MENIPAHIFDWIEQLPYEALTTAQKQELQQHISEEDYTALHQAALVANTYAKKGEETVQPTANALAQLHTVFDAAYPPNKKKLTALFVWKAAACFLLLATAALSFGWYNAQQQSVQTITHVKTDTVYVNAAKQMPNEVRIYDTIYVDRPTQSSKRKNSFNTPPNYGIAPYGKDLPNALNPLYNVPFSDKDQPQNRPKNNSIKDDTLIQRFHFVQL